MSSKKLNKLHSSINQKLDVLKQYIIFNDHINVEKSFNDFLDELVRIGNYNKRTWPVTWTRNLWIFFIELSKYEYATSLISLIDMKLENAKANEIEALEFIRIELLWNITKNPVLLKEEILHLLDRYPYNIEFAHSAAHVFFHCKDDGAKVECVKLYRKCIEAWKGSYNELIKNTYNIEIELFRETLEKGEYKKAKKQIEYIKSFEAYNKNALINNTTVVFNERLIDRAFTENKALEIERKIKKTIKHEHEALNKKSIEQLGLFSAVISFIVTAATASFSSTGIDAPLILITIGLILILFISTINLLNDNPKDFYKDFRFYLVLAFLGVSIYSIRTISNIENNSTLISNSNTIVDEQVVSVKPEET